MKLLAIDPGLATTGIAVFSHPWRGDEYEPKNVTEALACLVRSSELATDTSSSLAHRLGDIQFFLTTELELSEPDLIVVEDPPYSGDYGRHKGRGARAGTNQLYMALGAILAACGPFTGPYTPTELVMRHPSGRKEQRLELLSAAARSLKIKLPEGPRGGIRQDQLDAIWLGVAELLGPSESVGRLRGAPADR
jgi:hypothetical protein